jgi:uncharacterized membrane protein
MSNKSNPMPGASGPARAVCGAWGVRSAGSNAYTSKLTCRHLQQLQATRKQYSPNGKSDRLQVSKSELFWGGFKGDASRSSMITHLAMTSEVSRQPSLQAHNGDREAYWPAQLAVLAALLLYVTLPQKLTLGPTWLVPALEAALLIPLTITTPHRHAAESRLRRVAAIALAGVVNVANVASLIFLIRLLLRGGNTSGQELIFSAIEIWLTNVIIFALWYWELDRGGPGRRSQASVGQAGFLFPQMSNPQAASSWTPKFVDYLYVSFTNATAFSPTDAMPLTPWAKMLMLVQALASLLTVVLVAAHAVNVLH